MKSESVAILRSLLKCIEEGAAITKMHWNRKNDGNTYDFSIEVETTEGIREIAKSGDVSQDRAFDTCPLCGGELEVDDEYMQNRYGEAYMYESVQWTYFCNDCEEAGTYSELFKESYDRADEERLRRGE